MLKMSSLKKGFHLKKFLDFDKNDKIFYVNYYLDEYKVVLKESLLKEDSKSYDYLIDRFDLKNIHI